MATLQTKSEHGYVIRGGKLDDSPAISLSIYHLFPPASAYFDENFVRFDNDIRFQLRGLKRGPFKNILRVDAAFYQFD